MTEFNIFDEKGSIMEQFNCYISMPNGSLVRPLVETKINSASGLVAQIIQIDNGSSYKSKFINSLMNKAPSDE